MLLCAMTIESLRTRRESRKKARSAKRAIWRSATAQGSGRDAAEAPKPEPAEEPSGWLHRLWKPIADNLGLCAGEAYSPCCARRTDDSLHPKVLEKIVTQSLEEASQRECRAHQRPGAGPCP